MPFQRQIPAIQDIFRLALLVFSAWLSASAAREAETGGAGAPPCSRFGGAASCAAAARASNGAYPELAYSCQTNYYVDSKKGSDANTGESAAEAWKSLQKAASAGVFGAGVCVNFAPNGSTAPYTFASAGVELDSTSMGGSSADPANLAVMRCNAAPAGTLPAQPFLYYMSLGAEGSMPQCVIEGAGNSGSTSFILRLSTMKYFVIDGFEITTADKAGMENGLQIFTNSSRDIWFINNYVHDVGGQGAGADGGDFYYFIGNVILRTALRNSFQESGLSFAGLNDMTKNGSLDEVYGSVNGEKIHVVIANNVSALNKYHISSGDSDGHGLIFDTVDGAQTSCGADASAYSFGLLAYGNVAYGNGASGFSSFFSNNSAYINNTAYFDYRDPDNQASARPEFFNQCGSNNIWANNIAYNIVGKGVFAPAYTLFDNSQGGLVSPYGTGGGGNAWTNNMAYLSGTPVPTCYGLGIKNSGVCWYPSTESIAAASEGGTNFYNIDPRFNKPSLTPLVADFRLQPGSPAAGKGIQALTALGGPVVSTPNIGAY
jgi:hypothetical protein